MGDRAKSHFGYILDKENQGGLTWIASYIFQYDEDRF